MSEPLHIVCPHCHTTNRMRPEDLAKAADCGSCHRALFDAHPAALGEAAFEQAAAQLEPDVRLAKVNTEEAQALAARFQIRSIPTLALFLNGREIARQAGAMGASDIVRWTRAQLQRANV
ncbi:MAG: thioredoxin domain-containing protein [Ramlibacter sp.]